MATPASLGKKRRLSHLFDPRTGRTVITPVDDSSLSGPEGGFRDLRKKLSQIQLGGANGILSFAGTFVRHPDLVSQAGCIYNVTASTTLCTHTRKVLTGSVEQALQMDMDAVAVHVNFGSRYESEMLQILGNVARSCQQNGMPMMVLAYPRTETAEGADDNHLQLMHEDPDRFAQLVRHGVRIAADMGADIIKTIYTGSPESFRTVVDSAFDVPVVIAGGPTISIPRLFSMTYGAMQGGGAGIAGGRNTMHRQRTADVIRTLGKIVHDEMSDVDAVASYGESVDDEFESDLMPGMFASSNATLEETALVAGSSSKIG